MKRITDWEEEFRGKTLESIRPHYKGEDFKPYVKLEFAGNFHYEVHAVKGAFFDGCFINILRRAKPIDFVNVEKETDSLDIEAWNKDFLLFHMGATFRDPNQEGHPLELFRMG